MYPTSSILNLVTRVGNSRSLSGVKYMLDPYGERGEKVGETQHEVVMVCAPPPFMKYTAGFVLTMCSTLSSVL